MKAKGIEKASMTGALSHVLSNRKKDYLFLSAIGALIFFSWFHFEFPNGNFLYFGGDAAYPLNPSWNVQLMLPYTWLDENAGMANYRMVYFFWTSFFYLFSEVGLPLSIIQKLYLYINFILPGLSMYYLASVVYDHVKPSGDGKRLYSWIAALFYLFNPAILRFHQLYFFYSVFPFILAFFIQFVDSSNPKDRVKFGLLMFPLFFGFFMYLPAYNALAVLLVALLLYSVGYAIHNAQKIKQVLTSIIVLVSLELFLYSWILFPFFYVIIRESLVLLPQFSVFLFGNQYAELAQYGGAVIRVMAINFKMEESNAFYFSPGVIVWLVNLLFPIIAFSALLIRPRSRMVVYFALVAIIGIFVNVGPNPPWGWIYQWALNSFAILIGFRTIGNTMTIIALAYSVLIGIAISEIYLKIQGHFHKIGREASKRTASTGLVLSVIFLISINGWPMVTGAYFNTPSAYPNNVMHEIPSPYFMVNNWLNDQDRSQDYRVLALPPSNPINNDPRSSASSDWIWPDGHFSGSNVVPFIISRPVIHAVIAREGFISPLVFLMYNASEEKNFGEMVKVAGLLNTKYILVDSYAIRLGNLGEFRAIAEKEGHQPAQVINGTPLYDGTNYTLSNADFQTWAGGNPSGWANPTGLASQESTIVYSGSSSLKLPANTHVSQGVSLNSRGTYISLAYYLPSYPCYGENYIIISCSYTYYGLAANIYFDDGTIIQYTVEPSRFQDTSSIKYVALPRILGRWTNVTLNIADDVYSKYGSYKHVGGMGVQLLNSGDVPPVYFGSIKILSSLGADDLGVKNVVTYDKLGLYKIDDEHFFPRVYATSKSILINGGENQLVEFLNMNNFTSKKPVLLLSDQLSPSDLRDIQGLKLDESSAPNFAFQQVDPTKYIVHVTAFEPYFLVLSTGFDSHWMAYIDGKEVNSHLKANGYANAWLVNKTGSYDIVLKYEIQDYYHAAILVSLSTLIGSIAYVKQDWIRKLTDKIRTREDRKLERSN